MGNRVERTKKFDVYVSEAEFNIIKQMAEREDLTYSEYIRVSVMCDAVLSGNKKAIQLTLNNASKKARAFLSKKISVITGKLLGPKLEGG
jgi:hypothetical protein